MEFQDHKHALSYPLLDHLGILENSTTVFFQVRERPVINQPAASIVSLFSLIPTPSHHSSAGLSFVSIADPGCSQKGPSRERCSAGFYTPSVLNPHGSHHPVSQGCGSESQSFQTPFQHSLPRSSFLEPYSFRPFMESTMTQGSPRWHGNFPFQS